MNKKKTLLLALSAMLTAATMQAAPIAHSTTNLYAGFWQVDEEGEVARNYVAHIGYRNTIANQSSRTVLADLGSDLSTMFGNNWYTGSSETNKVFWSVFSWSSTGASTNYVIGLNETANNDVALDKNGVIKENLSTALGTANTGYSNFTGAYENLRVDTFASGSGGLGVGVGMTGDANSFASKVNAATPWSVGGLNSANLYAWVGDQASGGNAGDQWIWAVTRKIDGSDVTNNSRFFNQLTVESNGQVMVIPEPSTYALFGFGLLLMVVAYRRKISA
jgi:hypothetical protein